MKAKGIIVNRSEWIEADVPNGLDAARVPVMGMSTFSPPPHQWTFLSSPATMAAFLCTLFFGGGHRIVSFSLAVVCLPQQA